MKISVIIPVHNRPQMVIRAVNSVLRQTLQPHEIIVVDDGSDDNTAQILQQFRKQIIIISRGRRGVSSARNVGILTASGDWIALLDSDDEWLPDKLARAHQFHRDNPDLLIFQTEEIWVRNGRRVNPKKKHKKYGGWIFLESLPLCIVSPSAVVIQKSLFDEIGLFDENMPVCEDYDLWLRIARQYPFGLDPKPGIIKYGGHEGQLSRQYWGMDLYRIKAMEKHLDDPSLSREERKLVLSEIIRKLKVVISGAKKRGNDDKELMNKVNEYTNQLHSMD